MSLFWEFEDNASSVIVDPHILSCGEFSSLLDSMKL